MTSSAYILIAFGLYLHISEKHPEEKWYWRALLAFTWPMAVGQALGVWLDKPASRRDSSS